MHGSSIECPHAVCDKFGQRHLVQLACTNNILHLEYSNSYTPFGMSTGCQAIFDMSLQVAASAVLLANVALGRPAWTPTLEHYTGYSPRDIMECCKLMHKLHVGQHNPAAATPAIRDKYAQPRFYCVSAIQSSMEVLPSHIFR